MLEKRNIGIVNNKSCKLYAIYANLEHVHFLVSRSPAISEEKLATIVADSSECFINQNKLTGSKFFWQNSASAFSISKSDIDKTCRYIINTDFHKEYRRHKKTLIMESI